MTQLRIGFLLPRYSLPSTSHMPRVMQALAEWGVVVDVIHPVDRVVDVSTVRVEHDLYVLKKTSDVALSIAGALHAQGAAIVNPYPVTMALRDKIISSRILQSAGVPTPATYVVSHADRLAPLLDEGPLVVKPCQDSCGFGVRVVRSVAELAAVPAGKEPVIAQRYHAPEGRDRKICSIGGQLFGVKKTFPPLTEEEKHGEPFTPTPELCEIALRCGRAFGISLYGVDIIESKGQPYVVDMSSIPGFKGVPDASSHLAKYFYRAAERAAQGRPLSEPTAPIEAEPAVGSHESHRLPRAGYDGAYPNGGG
jgi:ribosomal protein S6--L-glutamate ligase